MSNVESIRPEVLTADEVAEKFRCTPQTVSAWARQGRIPGHQLGRRWLFYAHEIEQAFSAAKRTNAA